MQPRASLQTLPLVALGAYSLYMHLVPRRHARTQAFSQGFDGDAYIAAQKAAIKERLKCFSGGRLYLEIGGHLTADGHASRVLPGFQIDCKVKLLNSLGVPIDMIFCMDSGDVAKGREWQQGETYEETMWRVLGSYDKVGFPKPKIVFNLFRDQEAVVALEGRLKAKGYETFRRYFIQGYPNNLDKIVSEKGYGSDMHVPTSADLVVVTGMGSNCGKLSTCLGQVYLDRVRSSIVSGYAKYELFPIWNLPLAHPVNLAYEAATADIGDYNEYDKFYKQAYGGDMVPVNYNRDVAAYPILRALIEKVSPPESHMRKAYNSPTDMGINMAKKGIVDDDACIAAAMAEIKSRIGRYDAQRSKTEEAKVWVERCEKILRRAASYAK